MNKTLINFKFALLHRNILAALFSNSLIIATCANANQLPPPPRDASEVNQLFKLHLDLVLNHYSTQQLVPVIAKGDEYFIEKKQLDYFKIDLPRHVLQSQKNSTLTDFDVLALGFVNSAQDWIALNEIAELKYKYNSVNQSFSMDIPAEWMPTQMIGRDSWYSPQDAESGTGLLNNYDFYTYRPETGGYSNTLFTEQRFFSPTGVLKNSGIYSKSDFKPGNGVKDSPNNGRYRRYDTNWQYDDPQRVLSIVVGDILSGNKNSWGSSTRLGGLQIRKNYGIRPDLITYPLPQFNGQAEVPSTVDLLINGQKTSSTNVQSGPFILNNVPFVNGKGEAVIVTTDTVGRQVMATVPFYVSNSLLKPKLFDYSVSIGQTRQDYGVKDFSYGDFATSADMRYGVSDWLTVEGRSEFASDVQLVGLGSIIKLKNLGVLSGSYSRSWADQALFQGQLDDLKGDQYTLGYSYNQNRFGFSLNHSNYDREFTDLSRLQNTHLNSLNSRQSTVANTYFATEKSGTFGVAYIQTSSNAIENKMMNLSWAPILPSYLRDISVSLSSNYDLVEKDWRASFQLSIPLSTPLSTRATGVSLGYNHQKNADSAYVNLNHSVPNEGGFGFDLTHRNSENGQNFNQARVSYRNSYFNTDAGLSGYDNYSYWFGLSGSMILMSGNVFVANHLGESFALIDTNHVQDIPVLYENNLVGRSNHKGYVFVPSVTPYYAAKYSIDPLDLASNFNASLVENRMAAKLGSGVVVKFPIKKSYAANVHLIHENGQAVPTGAVVHRQDAASSYVGVDGIAYLEDLEAENTIRIQLSNENICEAQFSVDLKRAEQNIVAIKPVVCHEIKNHEKK